LSSYASKATEGATKAAEKTAKMARGAAQEAKGVASMVTAGAKPTDDTHVDVIWSAGQNLQFEFNGVVVSSSVHPAVYCGDILESVNDEHASKENLSELLQGEKPLNLRFRHLTVHEMRDLNERYASRMEMAKKRMVALDEENKKLKADMEMHVGGQMDLLAPQNAASQSQEQSDKIVLLEGEIESLQKRLAAAHEDPELVAAKEKLVIMQDEGESLQKQIALAHDQHQSLTLEVERLKEEKDEVKVSQLPAELLSFQVDVDHFQGSVAQADEIAFLKAELARFKDERDKNEDLDMTDNEIQELKDAHSEAEFARVKAELNQLKSERDELLQKQEGSLVVQSNLKVQIEKMKEEFEVQANQLHEAYEKVVQLTHSHATGTGEELAAALDEIAGLRDARAALESARFASDRRADSLEEDLNAANVSKRQLEKSIEVLKESEMQLRLEMEEMQFQANAVKVEAQEIQNQFTLEKEALASDKRSLMQNVDSTNTEKVTELTVKLEEKDLALAEVVEKHRLAIIQFKKESATAHQVSQWELNNAQNDLKQTRTECEEKRQKVSELELSVRSMREQLTSLQAAHSVSDAQRSKYEGEVKALKEEIAVNATHFRKVREEAAQASRCIATLTEERDALQEVVVQQKLQQDEENAQISHLQKEQDELKAKHEQSQHDLMKTQSDLNLLEQERTSVSSQNSDLRGWLKQYQNIGESDAIKRALELESKVSQMKEDLKAEKLAHQNSCTLLSGEVDCIKQELEVALASRSPRSDTDSDNDELFDSLADLGRDSVLTYGAVKEDFDLEQGLSKKMTKRSLIHKLVNLQEKLNQRPIVCHYSDAIQTDMPPFFKNMPFVKAAERPMIKLTSKMNRNKACMWLFYLHLVIVYLYLFFHKTVCPVK